MKEFTAEPIACPGYIGNSVKSTILAFTKVISVDDRVGHNFLVTRKNYNIDYSNFSIETTTTG